jgi:hypothetical protein
LRMKNLLETVGALALRTRSRALTFDRRAAA